MPSLLFTICGLMTVQLITLLKSSMIFICELNWSDQISNGNHVLCVCDTVMRVHLMRVFIFKEHLKMPLRIPIRLQALCLFIHCLFSPFKNIAVQLWGLERTNRPPKFYFSCMVMVRALILLCHWSFKLKYLCKKIPMQTLYC